MYDVALYVHILCAMAWVGGGLFAQLLVMRVQRSPDFIVVLGVMYTLATPYYVGIRQALEARGPDGQPTIDPAEMARVLDTRRPEVLVTVGGVGMAALVWLMVMKPG